MRQCLRFRLGDRVPLRQELDGGDNSALAALGCRAVWSGSLHARQPHADCHAFPRIRASLRGLSRDSRRLLRRRAGKDVPECRSTVVPAATGQGSRDDIDAGLMPREPWVGGWREPLRPRIAGYVTVRQPLPPPPAEDAFPLTEG